jgi:hypothetical protein
MGASYLANPSPKQAMPKPAANQRQPPAATSRGEATFPAVQAAMQTLDRLEWEIANAKTLDELKKAATEAAVLQRMFKPVNDVADRAGEIWIEAEAILGAELERLPKHKHAGPSGGADD